MENLLERFKSVSLFELYKMRTFIQNEINNPERIKEIRLRFKEGDRVQWYDKDTNKHEWAIVLCKKSKMVDVRNETDGNVWSIPYFMINIDLLKPELLPLPKDKKLTRHHLSIGEQVGFNHDGVAYYGKVARLNHKSVTVYIASGQKWRVGYGALVKVIDMPSEHEAVEYQVETD